MTALDAQPHRVRAYHRTPTTAQEANNADIALSVHLALEGPDGWEPLFDDYGVAFARAAEEPGERGTDDAILRSLVDPHLFSLPDGTYAVAATRVARGGASDGTDASSLLLFTSPDLITFTEVGLVDVGVSDGVRRPRAAYDGDRKRYVVAWTSHAGDPRWTTFGDLADPATRGEVSGGEPPIDVGDGTVAVSDAVATALEHRFGPVANTGAAPLPVVEVAHGGALAPGALPARIDLEYSDSSRGTLPITWDPDSVAAIDTSRPGEHRVRGRVLQTVYPTPFADERADPSAYRLDGDGETRFLMVATKDLHMDPVSNAGEPVGLPIRVARRIEDLSDDALAAGRTVEVDLLEHGSLDAHGQPMTGCFWAPEIHLIAGELCILLMPSYGEPTDMWTGRASLMRLRRDADGRHLDPAVPENWTAPEHVLRADGSDLNPIEGISLDMTYVEDSGRSYYLWQMLGSIFAATVDPAIPTRLTSDPVRILAPIYAWDNVIAEGPNVVEHGGVLHLLYSGSSVGDTYTTGLATATAGRGADLTDPATWTRLGHPIQKSGPFNGEMQLGTGHGMWSRDEHGHPLYVFHARTDHNGLTGRDMFVRRVHWAADGRPVLDMETEEELLPELREVEVIVRVR